MAAHQPPNSLPLILPLHNDTRQYSVFSCFFFLSTLLSLCSACFCNPTFFFYLAFPTPVVSLWQGEAERYISLEWMNMILNITAVHWVQSTSLFAHDLFPYSVGSDEYEELCCSALSGAKFPPCAVASTASHGALAHSCFHKRGDEIKITASLDMRPGQFEVCAE